MQCLPELLMGKHARVERSLALSTSTGRAWSDRLESQNTDLLILLALEMCHAEPVSLR